MVRQERATFKVSGGLGYEYERHLDGRSDGNGIVAAGWEYGQLFGKWLELSHDLDIYPEVTDSPSENFTLESVLGPELPLADSSVRAGLAHDYDNNPQPGVEDLDTSYLLGVVRGFD